MARTVGESAVLVVGAGGLGGAAALVLAGSGVGRLVLLDAAVTATADLSGQPALREADLGRPRAAATADGLARLFPGVAVEPVAGRFEEAAGGLLPRVDLVLHASGDAPTAFAANDAAVAAGRPLVHGGALHLSAQILSVVPGRTGCLRCLFEGPPPAEALPAGAGVGALGPLTGLAGALMGHEAVRLLEGRPGAYAGRLLTYGARSALGRLVPVPPRPGCPACAAAAARPAGAED